MNGLTENVKWSENVIIADGDYIDRVTFDLTVNFERMLGRRIPKADLGRWIDCVALDGGLREGAHETLAVFIHSKGRERLDNFAPGDYATEIDGMAFKDNLGEFAMSALPVEGIVTHDGFVAEALQAVCAQKAVKRVMLVADMERMAGQVRHALRGVSDEDKRVTVFAMQPLPGGNFRQEILGYSLMSALGIKGEEIDRATR